MGDINVEQIANHYVKRWLDYKGEAGHNKLLAGLKKYVKDIDDNNCKVVGIDVGCCVGDYIKNIYHICTEQNKQILCFEPNPLNILKLEEKINKNKNIKLFKHCASNETTICAFENCYGSTKLNQRNKIGNKMAGLRGGGEFICNVEVKKLDDVLDAEFKNENIIIKIIKIDTEGNDTNVIKGFAKYLPKTKYIIFECSHLLDKHQGPGIENPMKDIVDFLSNNGFDTYRIGKKKLFKVNDEYWHPIYESKKFYSNCFSLNKNDNIIHELINEDFSYKY